MKKLTFAIILLFFCLSFVKAQEAKLDTKLKPKAVPQNPKVKVIRDVKNVNSHHHNTALTWVFNSKIKILTNNPIIINYSNVDDLRIDKPTRSLLLAYKVENPEIVSLHQLAIKYCDTRERNILFSIDDEWQKQPDSVFIAIDAIKHVRLVDSENYPYLPKKKNQFVVVDIKTVNPPKKEEENDGKPKIYIR